MDVAHASVSVWVTVLTSQLTSPLTGQPNWVWSMVSTGNLPGHTGSWRQAPRGLLLDLGGRRDCGTLYSLCRECGTVNSLCRECRTLNCYYREYGTLNSLKPAHLVVGEVLLPAQVPCLDQTANTVGW